MTHQCVDNASCLDRDGFYQCPCNDGLVGDGFNGCFEPCDLFGVECNLATGLTVTLDETCRAQQYSFLPSDYSNLFVYAEDLTLATNVALLDTIPDACKLSAPSLFIIFAFI